MAALSLLVAGGKSQRETLEKASIQCGRGIGGIRRAFMYLSATLSIVSGLRWFFFIRALSLSGDEMPQVFSIPAP